MANIKLKSSLPVNTRVNIPQYDDPTLPKIYKNPNILSTQIKIDNSSNVTYVLKKFKNGTYTLFTYQQNQASGCYNLVGKQSGAC
jgi:hypothetical protein